MSSSSRVFTDGDNPKIDLPVFVSPTELVFSISKRRTLLTVYNPYGNEAQFRILATNPERFDVSLTRGTIKPNRRIDITIRLLSHKVEELPEPTDELQIIDHFRISIQIGALRGNRQVKVGWVNYVDYSDADDTSRLLGGGGDDMTSRVRMKSLKQSPAYISVSSSQRNPQSPTTASPRASTIRARSQPTDHQVVSQTGSNVNLVCFLSAIVCVVLLFLPLAIDSELCKKAKLYQSDQNSSQTTGILAQISNFLSVSYEMKFGCSFALGLFTYRLISTMPD
uniref:Motile sperm domain-containing protein 3 n=1 Tax=Aceria tosichella TaxID=561515 RepID=A0A6G1SP76_9ACAR